MIPIFLKKITFLRKEKNGLRNRLARNSWQFSGLKSLQKQAHLKVTAMFKVNNQDTRTTSLTVSLLLTLNMLVNVQNLFVFSNITGKATKGTFNFFSDFGIVSFCFSIMVMVNSHLNFP